MKSLRNYIVFALCIGLSSLLLTSCGSGKKTSVMEEVKKEGKIVLYTNAEFPPYESIGENGEIVGVDIEIGKEIAKKLGVELVVKNAEFDGIIAAIASGKGQLGLSGITINAERKKMVDFSNPYVTSVQYLILPENSTIAKMEDLAGKNIGGQTGTTGYLAVEDAINKGILKDKNTVLRAYNSAPIAMQSLISKRLDAIIIDELVAIQLAKGAKGFKAVEIPMDNKEEFGIAIAKGNPDLLEVLNSTIAELRSSGKLAEMFKKFEKKTTK